MAYKFPLVDLAAGVTGTLGYANGGTAQNSYTKGDFLYASSTNTLSKLGIGTTGQVLTVASGLPSWAAAASGGVTSITGTSNQIAASASTGAVTLSLVGPYTPATYTTHGVLIGEGTSSITALAAGTSGQVLQSGGASADPAYSTATYPATATGTGKILRADGTNWSATTATYPNVSVASGNVLYDNGTNFVSSVFPTGTTAPNQGLQYGYIKLTSAQIKALHGTPIQLIAAQGAGTVIVLLSPIWGKFTYGGTNVFVAGSAQLVQLFYGTTSSIVAISSNVMITGSSSTYIAQPITTVGAQAIAGYENLAINAYNSTATEISGNAGNDNTIECSFLYYVMKL